MATTTTSTSRGGSARLHVQRFGTFLSNMVLPNIGAFIAWGLITALFILETGSGRPIGIVHLHETSPGAPVALLLRAVVRAFGLRPHSSGRSLRSLVRQHDFRQW